MQPHPREKGFHRRVALIAGLLLAASPSRAPAAGVNLSWDDCGAAGARYRNFACGINTGSELLVGSFVPPAGLSQFLGMDALLEVQTFGPQLPSWWQLQSDGGCRRDALSCTFSFEALSSCADVWSGHAFGAMRYDASANGSSRGSIRLVCVIESRFAAVLSPSTEYYGFGVRITHGLSNGPGSCAGCSEPACVTLTSMELVQPAGLGDYAITTPARSATVSWQATECASGIRNRTWGQLKSLYR